jgi:hypothetical protein
MSKLSTDFRAHLRFFAFYLVNGTVHLELLPFEMDYKVIFEEPSALEQVFAIWSNVLELDDQGKPTNEADARRRAAQYIRGWVDRNYVVIPPFEEWELALHL